MKLLLKITNILFIVIVLFALVAAIGSAIKKEPFLLTVIRSNSMYPVWERGDMVVVNSLSDNKDAELGDIIIFNTDEGSLANKGWIAHRIIGGNSEEGFITQGDANAYTDQDGEGTGPIQPVSIAGKALTILGKPIVIPLVGHLSLYVEKFQASPFLLPIIASILGLAIFLEEIKGSKVKRRKKSKGFDLQIIYFLGGIIISIIIGASMLASSQHFSLNYEVSESTKGVLMGSDVGIMKIGEEVEKSLANLTNQGAVPLISTITTNDSQISPSLDKVLLKPNDEISTTFKVKAQTIGKYESSIHVGLFYPLLPAPVIYMLAKQSYWLALAIVSLIPGLPLMLYPIINQQLRKRTIRDMKKSIRKIKRYSLKTG